MHLFVCSTPHLSCPLPKFCPYKLNRFRLLTTRSLRPGPLLLMMMPQLLLSFSNMLLTVLLGGRRESPRAKPKPKMSKGFVHGTGKWWLRTQFTSTATVWSSSYMWFDGSDVLQYLIGNPFAIRLLSSTPVLRLHSQFYGSATAIQGFQPRPCNCFQHSICLPNRHRPRILHRNIRPNVVSVSESRIYRMAMFSSCYPVGTMCHDVVLPILIKFDWG